MQAAITLESLGKSFGKTTALESVSLSISPATVYGLLGPNGAGKTTIVRILSTILKPSAGAARVGRHSVVDEPERVRDLIGVLPEDTGLYDRLTGDETLRFYGQMHLMEETRIRERTDLLLKLLGLEEKRKARVGTYSRGMRQKLALARALVHDPPVLLLDEPTLGLDVMSARAIRDYVRDLSKEGRTVLLTTNNMYEARMLCTDLAILNKGKLVASGTVGDLETMARSKDLEEVFLNFVKGEVNVQN